MTISDYPNNPSSLVILRRSRSLSGGQTGIWPTKSPDVSGFTSLHSVPRYIGVLEQTEGMTGEPRPCGRGWARANSYSDRL
ncbi:MAG: hypothetical protein ACETWQ_00390 [Phycisphaerae bacterium]